MLLAHGQVYRNYERNYKEKFKGGPGGDLKWNELIRTSGDSDRRSWLVCSPDRGRPRGGREGDRLQPGMDGQFETRLGREDCLQLDPVIFGDYPLSMKSRLNGEDGLPKLPAFTEEEQKMLKGRDSAEQSTLVFQGVPTSWVSTTTSRDSLERERAGHSLRDLASIN